jgi:hypothetical protein
MTKKNAAMMSHLGEDVMEPVRDRQSEKPPGKS